MLFKTYVYVQVFANRLRVRSPGGAIDAELHAVMPFTHQRMLLGTFTAARDLLHPAVQALSGGWWTRDLRRLHVLMHPMERIEGGLSEIEHRAFRELGFAVGARHVVVWTGEPLSDDQALALMKRQRRPSG